MDFDFKEEQLQFADALKRWIARDYSFEARRAIIHSPQGTSGQAWATLAELGMTALPVPQEQGGFDGSAVDMFVVMRELGRGLVVEPYFATVLGAEFLKLGGAHAQLLERVAAGDLKLACALGERQSRHDMTDIACRVTRDGDEFVIDGEKKAVIHGAQAGSLIVSPAARVPSATATASRCWWCPPTRQACTFANTARWTGCARPMSALTKCVRRQARSLARKARAGISSMRCSITARACCAPRRSAQWRRSSRRRSNT